MIVVTGASGQLGRGVVHGLLARVPADRIGAAVRDGAKASSLTAAGIHVQTADFGDLQKPGNATLLAQRLQFRTWPLR